MRIPLVWWVVVVLLAASTAPLAFADEKTQDVQRQTFDESVAKPIEVEVWVIAVRSAGDADDDSASRGPSGRGSLRPDVESRNGVEAWIHDLAEQKRLVASQHFLLATIAGHRADAKIGADVPVIGATSLNEFGRSNSVTMHPVGTTLGVMPRLGEGDVIRLFLRFESSDLRTSDDVVLVEPKQGRPLAANQTDRRSLETAVEVGDGDVVVALSADADTSRSEESYVILVSARRLQKD